MKRRMARVLAMVMAVALMGTSTNVTAFAARICDHHLEHKHNAGCGYVEAVEGVDCTHVHGDECYSEVEVCVHEHDENCGYAEGSCTHTCSVESRCITTKENCNHSHDENCGYVQAQEGTPCSFVCNVCEAEVSDEDDEDAVCICEDKCTADAVNEECPVCSLEEADLALCAGEEAEDEEITCICTDKCVEDSVNEECPVCFAENADLNNCIGEVEEMQSIITAWSFVDEIGYIDLETNTLALPGANAENVALKEYIISLLPASIKASINDAEETLALSGWECEDYPQEGAYAGTYTFSATLPEGYTLGEEVSELTVNVELGGAGLYDEEQTTGDFTVTGGTYGQDYTYDSEAHLLTIISSTEITIANTAPEIATEDMIFVADGVNANIILAGVYISVGTTQNNYDDCPLRIADNSTGDVTITIQDETINTLTSYYRCAGIQKTGDANTGTLTIQGGSEGSGVLNATGGYFGAGIGGGYEGNGICANIKIENAIVNATGGSDGGAGIGAGSGSEVSALATNIQIINSTVTATGNYASGIGGGALGEASNITICGGSVKAVVNRGIAYGIGSGHERGVVIPTNGTENVYLLKIENPEGKTVYIDGIAYSHNSHNEETTVYAYVTGESHTVKLVGAGENVNEVEGTAYHFYPTTEGTFVAEDTVMDTVSDFDITGGTAGVDYLYVAEEETLYLLTDIALIISNKQDVETATTKIETGMNCNINVTFKGVNIDVSDTTGACAFKIPDNSTGMVTITLADNSTNTLKSSRYYCAGIQKNGDAGTLMIQGENSGNGVLNATGGYYGAGIGGGSGNSSNNITINNATVTANGGNSGAGIGGGRYGNASNITIKNAIVTANGGNSGAGIGGGADGSGSNIAITGGSVKAEGNNAIGGRIAVTPTDSLGAGAKNVYLLVIENPDGEEIKINGVAYNCKAHQEETYVYAYLTGKEHTVEVGGDETEYFFIDGTFVKKSELVLTDAMDFSIEGGSYGADYLYDSNNNVLYILNDTKLTIQNKEGVAVADTTIVTGVDCNANIVLAGVNIDVSGNSGACAFKIPDNSTGTVTITLKDGTTNTMSSGDDCAGVQKNGDEGTLIIQGENSRTGVLNVTGGDYGAGIGSAFPYNVCNITISNAVVNATGGDYGAGIGLSGGGARNITIRNAVVTATGGARGAGIGGSSSSSYVENIAIYNSSVKALGDTYAPAIGWGWSFGSSTPNPVTPTASLEDGAANVYLFEMNETSGKVITINGVTYPDNHMGESKLYVYLPATPANEVTIDGVTTKYCYDTTIPKWVTAIDIPEEPEETTFTYDGEAKTYVLLKNDTYYTITGNVQTNAGNYTVTVSLKDKGNTAWSDGTTEDKEYSFVINKADSVLETVPTPKTGLTYKGEEQNLISAGTATGGTMQYSLDGVSWSPDIPSATDAGKYTVYYKIAGNENYNGSEADSFTVNIAKKQLTVTGVAATSRDYIANDKTVDITGITLSGKQGTDDVSVKITGLKGTLSSANADTYTSVTLPTLTLINDDKGNYELVQPTSAVATNVTINKLNPTITLTVQPSITKTYGDEIFDLGATEDSPEAGLQYEVTEGADVVSVSSTGKVTILKAGNATITVTVPESTNYNSVSKEIIVTVEKAENAPNMPGNAMNVSNSYTKIGDVPLPTGWEWQDADKEFSLPVDSPVTAVAVYTGADKGNYKNESVEIEVTRADHDHVESEVLYDTNAGEHAPTCTEDGLGHVECTIEGCDKTLRTNVVVDALGHNYVSKVTKQPTTTEEGIMTYTCSNCGDSYTKPISKLTPSGGGSDDDSGDDETGGSSGGSSDGGSTNDTPATETPTPQTPTGGTTAPTTPQPGGNIPVAEPDEETDNPEPFINGEDGKEGWDVIRDEVEDAEVGDTVTVDMNGTTVVPGDVLNDIKGKDITMVFDLGNGVAWSVNGKDITSDNVGDIDFEVKVGADANDSIPVEVRNTITGESNFVNISLAYDGEFGFEAVLSVNLEKENAGLYANLFYYNPQTNEMEFICSDVIAEDGTAELIFTHASEYTIVIDEAAMDAPASSEEGVLPEIGVEAEEDNSSDATNVSDPLEFGSDDNNSAWWIILLIALLAVAGVAGFVVYSKKKKSE